MRDRVIRTHRFTFATFDTFGLVNVRVSVYHRYGTFWTNQHAWVGNTALADIADFIFVGSAGCTGGRNHLHERRLIVFFVNIAGLDSFREMNGTVFGP